jgi:small GTP-binding protein
MGNLSQSLFKRPAKKIVMMLGLDAAGKTTILYKLCRRFGEVQHFVPTIGMNIEILEHSNFIIKALDVGGADRIRLLWRPLYEESSALIFVVDCSDFDRIEVSIGELNRLLEDEVFSGKPLLVFANKQDFAASLSTEALAELLGLNSIAGREWRIEGTIAIQGKGVNQGLDWLAQAIEKRLQVPK